MTCVRMPLFLALLFMLSGPCYAQTPWETPGGRVRLQDDLLSVKAENASFGQLLREIGREAGFEVVISPDVSGKTLSTDFSDVELQRGIQRLFTLLNHGNYFIHYGEDGSIRKIEVFGATSLKPVTRQRPDWRRQPAPRRPTVPPRRQPSRPTPPRPSPPPVPPEQPPYPEEFDAFEEPTYPDETFHQEEPGDGTENAPYIPPRRAPAYIPPRG
jgi:hypothetical protein